MTNFSETDYAGLGTPTTPTYGTTPEGQTTQSTAEKLTDKGHQLVEDADAYVRSNPVPVVLGALALGFVLGLMVRHEPEPTSRKWARRLEDGEDHIKDLADALISATKKSYKKSAKAVKSGVGEAVSAVRDVDVDDYVDPVASWFKKLWK